MRSFAPRPILLVLALLLIAGAISFIQFRFQPADASNEQAKSPPTQETKDKPTIAQNDSQATDTPRSTKPRTASKETPRQDKEPAGQKQAANKAPSGQQSIASKEAKYPRAKEIVDPTGFINTDGISLADARGKKVVLLEFWTYSCYNCQNAQPYINSFYEEYADDGLQVIGIHKPEFEFEKDYANVAQAVKEANIKYPVVLDNNDATWNAYDQNYWPTWYLIDADGFIRYKHIGEGAYEETEKKIQELLAEKDRS